MSKKRRRDMLIDIMKSSLTLLSLLKLSSNVLLEGI